MLPGLAAPIGKEVPLPSSSFNTGQPTAGSFPRSPLQAVTQQKISGDSAPLEFSSILEGKLVAIWYETSFSDI